MAERKISRYYFGSSLIRLRNTLTGSCILNWISLLYPRLESRMMEERDWSGGRPASFFLRSFENSILLRMMNRLISFLGSLSLGIYGQIGALYGVFSTVIWFVTPGEVGSFLRLFFSLGITAISVPILHVGYSLSYEIENSRFVGRFLFVYCGCPREERTDHARHGIWFSLFCAFFLAVLDIWIPIWKIVLFAVILIGIRLLFQVPEIGILLLCFFFPFFNLLRAPTFVLAGFSGVLGLAWWQKAITGKRPLRIGLCEVLLVAFCLCYLLGGIIGVGGVESFLESCVRVLFLLMWFPVRSLLENPKWRDRAVFSLCISSFLIAVLGIFEYYFGNTVLQYVDVSRFSDIGRRVTVTYANPNFLAFYLTLCAPFSLGLFLDETRQFRRRLFGAGCFLATLLCVIFTWTRGAWLGVFVSVVLCLLLWNRKSFLWVFFAPVFLCVAIPFIPDSVSARFLSIGSFGESSIRYRFYTWSGVHRMLSVYPFGIGVGEAAFSRLYPFFAVSGTERVMHTHRLDLQLRSDLGIFGFGICAVLLLLIFLRYIYLLRTGDPRIRISVLVPLCALVGALVMGAFDYIWYHFGNFLLFWVIAAMGVRLPSKERGNHG